MYSNKTNLFEMDIVPFFTIGNAITGKQDDKGICKIPYKGYEISLSNTEFKEHMAVFNPIDNTSIYESHIITGETILEAINVVNQHIAKNKE